MKTLYIILIALLSSCSLFKKTVRSSTSASFDFSKQTEALRIDLKTAHKETQTYSFWKDSVFYQYSLIKEQVDQTKTGSLKVQENQEAKQEQTLKETKPMKPWIYVIALLGIIGFALIFKKLSM